MKRTDVSSSSGGTAEGVCAETCAGEARIVLGRGELRSWKRARVGTTLRAREGAVWVTQEGDGLDVILSAGESFRVTRSGRVIAQALQGAALLGVSGRC